MNPVRPDFWFTPHPSSVRGCTEFDLKVAATPCQLCHEAIGHNVWVLYWNPGAAVHLDCQDLMIKTEDAILADPFLNERAAKTLSLPIEEFKRLPGYERKRHLLAAKEQREKEAL